MIHRYRCRYKIELSNIIRVILNYIIGIIFTFDYILRLIFCERKLHWFLRNFLHIYSSSSSLVPYNLVDLMAVISFYLEIFLHVRIEVLALLRIIRIIRIVRFVKLWKFFSAAKTRIDNSLVSKGVSNTKIQTFHFFMANIYDQIWIISLICIYTIGFAFVLTGKVVDDVGIIIGGQCAVIAGLFVFLNGLRWGLMPVGENIGKNLPLKVPLLVMLVIVFFLGCLGNSILGLLTSFSDHRRTCDFCTFCVGNHRSQRDCSLFISRTRLLEFLSVDLHCNGCWSRSDLWDPQVGLFMEHEDHRLSDGFVRCGYDVTRPMVFSRLTKHHRTVLGLWSHHDGSSDCSDTDHSWSWYQSRSQCEERHETQ